MLKYGLDIINFIVNIILIILLIQEKQSIRNKFLFVSLFILVNGLTTTLTPINELTPYYGKNNTYYTQGDIKENGYYTLILGVVLSVLILIYSFIKKIGKKISGKISKSNKVNKKIENIKINENIKSDKNKDSDYISIIDVMTRDLKDIDEISKQLGLNKHFLENINTLRNKFNDEYINSLIKTVKYRVDNNIVISKKEIKEISEKEENRIIEGEKNKINNIFLAAEMFRDGHTYIDITNKTELLPIYIDVISKNYDELLSLNIDKNNKALLEFFYSRSKEYREYIKELDLYYDFLDKYLPESYPDFVREVQALDKKFLEKLDLEL